MDDKRIAEQYCERDEQAIGGIDEKIIAEAKAPTRTKKHRDGYGRAVVLVACLSLAVAMAVSVFMVAFDGNIGTLTLDEHDLYDMFDQSKYDGVRYYKKVYAPNLQALNITGAEYSEYLPVYKNSAVKASKSDFKNFIKKYSSAACGLYGVQMSDHTIERYENDDGTVYYSAYIGDKKSELIAFSMQDNQMYFKFIGTREDERLSVNGEYFSVDMGDTDEAIAHKLTDAVTALNDMLGTDYERMKLVNDYSISGKKDVYVYLYNDEYTVLPEYIREEPLTADYIKLTLSSAYMSDELFLVDLSAYRAITPWDEYYESMGKSRMLTVEQAEALLQKGYVFNTSVCELCASSQAEVDFSEYDAVFLEYLRGDDGTVLPCYTFYKELEENTSGMRIYAKAYVTAVEIDGLDRYFAAMHERHVSLPMIITTESTLSE